MKKKEIEVLGSVFSISLQDVNSSLIFDTCFEELRRVEKKYTRFDSNSYLMKLNSHLFKIQTIDTETKKLLKFAQDMQIFSNNYFNISQIKVLEKFGYGTSDKINTKVNFVDNFISKNYILFSNKLILFKEIEIGGFGKGYAIKRLRMILDKFGVKKYLLNAGGDIYSRGKSEVYLESPIKNSNVFGKISIENQCICSSSPSRRFFNSKHHLINPKTKDSNSDLLQVYIVDEDTIKCDCISTALFTMGFDKAKNFSIKNKLKVILISKSEIYSSVEFKYL